MNDTEPQTLRSALGRTGYVLVPMVTSDRAGDTPLSQPIFQFRPLAYWVFPGDAVNARHAEFQQWLEEQS